MKQAVWLAAALMMLLPLGKVYSKERSERENNTLRIMSYNRFPAYGGSDQ